MKKVISIALFGRDKEATHGRAWYAQYLPAFVRAHHAIFPAIDGWELLLHVDEHNAPGLPTAYAHCGLLRLVIMQEAPLTQAMLWRMAPVFSDEFDYVFCRDVDALPTPRDRLGCDRFIRSGSDVYLQADSVSHTGVMGGMGGWHAPEVRELTGLRSFDDFIAFGVREGERRGGAWENHGADQDVLNTLVYKSSIGRKLAVFEHRYAGWANGAPGRSERLADPRACASEPMPDGPFDERNSLSAHLGAPGFDHFAARVYYDQHLSSEVLAKTLAAEAQGQG